MKDSKNNLLIKYWDFQAPIKNFSAEFDVSLFTKFVKKEDAILDFGCGQGRIISKLVEHGYKFLTGMDISSGMLKIAKKNSPNVKFIKNDTKSIPLPSNSINCIIFCSVLTCIPNSTDQANLIDEFLRILKPGGIIYVVDFLLNSDLRNKNRYADFSMECCDSNFPYGTFKLTNEIVLRHHTVAYLKQLFKPFSFKIFNKRMFKTMNNNSSNGFIYIGSKNEKTL